jgi:PAP2 superfamily
MRSRPGVSCLVVWLLSSGQILAQEAADAQSVPPPVSADAPVVPSAPPEQPSTVLAGRQPIDTSFWAPFKAVPRDLVRFASVDTLSVLSIGVGGAAMAHNWDDSGIAQAKAHLNPRTFRPGNIGGNFYVQVGGAIGLYSIACVTGSDKLSAVGADLVTAQLLTQGIVQAGKAATRRTRPDGTDNHSLPSGHTASAFATATVLQRRYGWAVGAPAYAFGAYVATARMAANRHHLSDVLAGAAVGIAVGRTVTVGVGKSRFAMGVAPTPGGAAVTLTKQ